MLSEELAHSSLAKKFPSNECALVDPGGAGDADLKFFSGAVIPSFFFCFSLFVNGFVNLVNYLRPCHVTPSRFCLFSGLVTLPLPKIFL